MRQLTERDRPEMLALIALWDEYFSSPTKTKFPLVDFYRKLDPTQLVVWMEQYDNDTIRKAFQVTHDWYVRKHEALCKFYEPDPNTRTEPKPLMPTDVDRYKYASSVMRNIDRARSTAKKILGGVL